MIELLLSLQFATIKPIMEKRCVQCHNVNWVDKNWLDENKVKENKYKILDRVVIRRDMPPANSTGMTEKERIIVKEYLKNVN